MSEQQNPDAVQEQNGKELDVGKLQEQINSLLADKDKLSIENRNLKSTVGDAAKLQKQLDDLIIEKSQLMENIEQMKSAARDKELTSHLETALKDAGAKSVSTAIKLVDRSKIEFDKDGQVVQKSIEDAIAAVKVSDSILFGEPEQQNDEKGAPAQPDVRRAAQDSGDKSGYEAEIAAARMKRDGGKAIQEVLRKYNKI